MNRIKIEADFDEDYNCKACNNGGGRVYQLSNGEWEMEECNCLELLEWILHLQEHDFGIDETHGAI